MAEVKKRVRKCCIKKRRSTSTEYDSKCNLSFSSDKGYNFISMYLYVSVYVMFAHLNLIGKFDVRLFFSIYLSHLLAFHLLRFCVSFWFRCLFTETLGTKRHPLRIAWNYNRKKDFFYTVYATHLQAYTFLLSISIALHIFQLSKFNILRKSSDARVNKRERESEM